MTETRKERLPNDAPLAVVTGATGMIGRPIVRLLLEAGYRVRVLSRRQAYPDPRVELMRGDILDGSVLAGLLRDARLLFHCAGELHDPSRMRAVNVEGTRNLIDKIRGSGIKYFCHLSSAGVVGLSDRRLIDETAPCHPRNKYEKTKLAAEELLADGIEGCRTIILRPTNVIDDDFPGPFALALADNWSNRLRLFIKGRECAHLLHAQDVAAAAVYFVGQEGRVGRYFVSRDEEESNTFGELWRLCRQRRMKDGNIAVAQPKSLPLPIPYLMRWLSGRPANLGNVRYSSRKLLASGFAFPGTIQDMVVRICACPKDREIII